MVASLFTHVLWYARYVVGYFLRQGASFFTSSSSLSFSLPNSPHVFIWQQHYLCVWFYFTSSSQYYAKLLDIHCLYNKDFPLQLCYSISVFTPKVLIKLRACWFLNYWLHFISSLFLFITHLCILAFFDFILVSLIRVLRVLLENTVVYDRNISRF